MEQYVGMDVSLKETSICVVEGDGKIVSDDARRCQIANTHEMVDPHGLANCHSQEHGPLFCRTPPDPHEVAVFWVRAQQ